MSRRLFWISVPGLPVSKGSLTGFVAHGRVIMKEKRSESARKRLEAWRTMLRTLVKNEWTTHRGAPIGRRRARYLAPVRVELGFVLPRPKSAPSYVVWPTTYPDIDKLARVVLDELAGICFEDDRQVVELEAWKEYAGGPAELEPGVDIQIVEVEGDGA